MKNQINRVETTIATVEEEIMSAQAISTLCPPLNGLLPNGVKTKTITFITGPRNSGKTQLCLQLALSVQLNFETCKTLYIQAHKLFPINRLRVISHGVLNHLKHNLNLFPYDETFVSRINSCNVTDSLMNTIFRYSDMQTNNIFELINSLPEIIEKHNIKLLILDNIDEQLLSQPNAIVNDSQLIISFARFVRLLNTIAHTKNIAVVITAIQRPLYNLTVYHDLIHKLEELCKFQINLLHLESNIFKASCVKSPLLQFYNPINRRVNIKVTNNGVYELS